jgi:hypothetical protein
MAKKPEDVMDVLTDSNDDVKTEVKESVKEDIINTLGSIKEPAIDKKLQQKELNKALKITKGKKVKFECSSVYATLYPEGFVSTFQGVIINLIFDNRTVELSEAVANYVKAKIKEKADKEAAKLNQFKVKKQNFRGE